MKTTSIEKELFYKMYGRYMKNQTPEVDPLEESKKEAEKELIGDIISPDELDGTLITQDE